ncbi:beta-galactosidase GalB [Sphingomonas sp. DG1-23]|uniref:beta-galactosidase GalB n=1 Tax=Sphingomonas sp. DG1-23 TaxID=3068316 RepID=UPI00273DE673|nr:beta-galactosidase GalB [Sphingomonas sp. DG1-23]MDP5279503.1 beta-galactosidase GalB [Sphingomonas sp. DG1-23]
MFTRSVVVAFLLSLLLPMAAHAQRDRIRISDDWRFTKGDPDGLKVDLRYDVRPTVQATADGKAADAQPDAAVAAREFGASVLKAWILPSGNAFIADPARRHVRPAGDPGGDVPYVLPGFDDSTWQRLSLPHDWAIAEPFLETGPYGGMGRLPSWGIGWYRKNLAIPASDRNRSIFLDVDGAMAYATVWLNGRLVGGWPYGYNGWRLDLTPYVAFGGKNQLAIRLDNPPESARWYPGGGLYRDVWLVKTNRIHVAQWGSTVTTPQVSAAEAAVAQRLRVANDASVPATVDATTEIYVAGPDGKRAGRPVTRFALGSARIAPGETATLDGLGRLANPRLWGPPPAQRPNLYVAVSTLRREGRVIDTYETPFGVRTILMDGRQGLVVNGEKVKIQGVNNHHDLGALGAAFNLRAAERQLEIMRDMGVNALRMSHNPPAPELLDLADRMGFVVIDEVFDSWERKKTPLDFHLIFKDWGEQDLRAMLRRDRNHPSVIMWSIGNEVGEQYTGEEGAQIARRLVSIVREEDPTRQTTTSMNYARPEMPLPTTIDAIGINYQGAGVRSLPPQYRPFAEKFPDKILFESESASTLSSRGEYLFPVSGSISGPVRPGSGGDPARQQVSAYELHAADFGSSPDREFAAMDQNPSVAGEFVWTGFDYLGEPTPYYGARSSYSGIVDLAGFPKDRFWLYQSRWRPDLKFAHILPHWTWPGREGQVTPVHVFTSADEAELFVNGKSQGKQKRAPFAYRFRWDYVVYEPGEVKVVTWKGGQPWATQTVATTGSAAALAAGADRAQITGDGRDLAFVTVRVLDAEGRLAPRAANPVRFSVTGPGELVATDNGDPTSFVPFGSATRPAFNGLALAIVRARPGRKGTITVRAESDGLVAGIAEVVVR